jgi:hypothetical protein
MVLATANKVRLKKELLTNSHVSEAGRGLLETLAIPAKRGFADQRCDETAV